MTRMTPRWRRERDMATADRVVASRVGHPLVTLTDLERQIADLERRLSRAGSSLERGPILDELTERRRLLRRRRAPRPFTGGDES